jgi:sialic acid synthase SpsE
MNIIAEIGWNHMGDMALAKQMINEAAANGATHAKFQSWSVSNLKPGVWDTDGRREIYEKAQLTLADHKYLKQVCDDNNIEFMSSVFSLRDIEIYKQVTRYHLSKVEIIRLLKNAWRCLIKYIYQLELLHGMKLKS